MPISSKSVPKGTKITFWEEPVIGRVGVELLSPMIASIFARWGALEKQINQVFTLVTNADPDLRLVYDGLKGWDRRVELIVSEAEKRLGDELADLVKVVLRLVKNCASKRDELAHRMWAVAEGFEGCLVLLPPDDQHQIAESVLAVKAAGRCNIPIDTSKIYEGSSLVSSEDLAIAIMEGRQASERMTNLLWGHFFPEFADVTGNGFAEYRANLAGDNDVIDRLKNVKLARQRAERLKMQHQKPA